ncbi:hypothetical protein JYT16_00120 [Gemmatimonas aurantiaca]|nr:hypothetical protein [Gemmatimonas aurantiaca]
MKPANGMKDCRLVIILSLAALIILIPLNLAYATKADSLFTFQRDLPSGRYYANSGKWFSVVEKAILETETRAHAIFGAYALPHYSLYLVDTDEEFNSFVGVGFPDWGGAVAIPSRSIIVLKSPSMSVNDKPLNQLAAHEYAHLLIHHLATPNNSYSGAGATRPPRWLDEGLAMYLSSEWSAGDFVTISQAQITGGFVPLASYDSLNLFGQSKAQVAYAQSYLAVKYLIDYYGAESVAQLLAELRKGKTDSQALEAVLALDVAGFEDELFGYIYEQFTLFGVLMGSTIFWLALAALVVIGAWKARKNKAARYAQWEEEEKLQSTDFDYGDPDNPEKIEDEDRPWE